MGSIRFFPRYNSDSVISNSYSYIPAALLGLSLIHI